MLLKISDPQWLNRFVLLSVTYKDHVYICILYAQIWIINMYVLIAMSNRYVQFV